MEARKLPGLNQTQPRAPPWERALPSQPQASAVGLRSRPAGCATWPAAASRHAASWPTRRAAASRLARVRVRRATAAGRPAAAARWAPTFAWATAWLSRHACRHAGCTAADAAGVRSSAAVRAPALLWGPAAAFDPATALHSAAALLRGAAVPANRSSPDA